VGSGFLFCPECGIERGYQRTTPRAAADAGSDPSEARGLTRLVLGLTLLGPLALAAALVLLFT
jgi:hypothetical protein